MIILLSILGGCTTPVSVDELPPVIDTSPTVSRPSTIVVSPVSKPNEPQLSVASSDDDLIRTMSSLLRSETSPLNGDNVGYYMDVQFASLQEKLTRINVKTMRSGQDIQVVIPGALIFNSNSARLNSLAEQTLSQISTVLSEYYKTLVIVEGHADKQGDAAYNQRLSEKRALAVGRFLFERQVSEQRLLLMGFGASRPVSSNQSESGRAQNRRIVIILKPIKL